VSKKWRSHFFEEASLRSAQSVFSDVHAAGKNDLILFRRSGGETLRDFSTVCPDLKGQVLEVSAKQGEAYRRGAQ